MITIKVPKGEGDELETPPWLFKQLNDVFSFQWDACSTEENNLVGGHRNALCTSWKRFNPIYMNPPYSNVTPFLRAAVYAQLKGVTTVALLKGDPSTKWWAENVLPHAQCRWLEKRVRFYYKGVPTESCANFPSVLAFFWGFPKFEASK